MHTKPLPPQGRLSPKSVHLVIPLIASLMLAACETGSQLPYEQSPDGASYESPTPAKSSTTASPSAVPSGANKSQVVTTYANDDGSLEAPAPTSTPGNNPILTNAVPQAATNGAAGNAAIGKTQVATATSAPAAGDQYLLAPAASTSGAAINYQQSNNASAPIVVIFASDDPRRIDVIVRDDLPVKAAVLRDPQRHRFLAAGLTHTTIAYDPQEAAQSGLGVKMIPDGQTIFSGANLGIPINPTGSTAGGLLSESRFSFTIPDRAAYDGSWNRWVIHIDLGDGMTTRSMELLPPKPLG